MDPYSFLAGISGIRNKFNQGSPIDPGVLDSIQSGQFFDKINQQAGGGLVGGALKDPLFQQQFQRQYAPINTGQYGGDFKDKGQLGGGVGGGERVGAPIDEQLPQFPHKSKDWANGAFGMKDGSMDWLQKPGAQPPAAEHSEGAPPPNQLPWEQAPPPQQYHPPQHPVPPSFLGPPVTQPPAVQPPNPHRLPWETAS